MYLMVAMVYKFQVRIDEAQGFFQRSKKLVADLNNLSKHSRLGSKGT